MSSRKPQQSVGTVTRSLLRQIGLPVGILLVVTVVDLATGPDTVFYPFLLLAPTLAAVTAPPLAILGIGCVSLPLRYWLAWTDGYLAAEYSDLFQVSTWIYVLATGLAMYLSAARIRHERALLAVSQVAIAAQRAILLPPTGGLGGVRLAVRYFAVADEAELGGDLYLALDTPYGLRLVIGDVLGKGLGVVRTAAITVGAFREAAYDEPDLVEVARRMETSLTRNAPPDQFVTALLVEVRRDTVALVHRGHEQPVLIRRDGGVEILEPPDPGVPLGLGDLDPGGVRAWECPFGTGDLLLLVTDGVADARDPLGGTYPLVERVVALLGPDRVAPEPTPRAWADLGPPGAGLDPAAAVEVLGDDLARHVGILRLTDDALMLALARAADDGPRADD